MLREKVRARQIAETASAVERAVDARDVEPMKTSLEELQTAAMMAVGEPVYGGGRLDETERFSAVEGE